MVQNVLITGGAGNLGRVTAEALRGSYGVTLFDRVTPDQVPMPWQTDLPFVLGDLTSLADCMRAISIAQADAIVHWGAIPFNTERQPFETGPFRGIQRFPEDETMRVNTMGTYYLLDAARRLGVRKVVMASTYYVLGMGFRISKDPWVVDYLPIDEEHPCRPEDTYGLSKLLDEEILEAFGRAYGIQGAAFRLMGVVYPHRETGWFQTNMMPEAQPDHKGGPYGTTWQYVDARDVVQACQLALEAKGLERFEAFYLSTDTMLAEETRVVVERCCPDLKEMAANLKGYEGMISINKARKKLGYEPKWSWRK
jgi:nucleoside-diphosphate-sugar epimerase